MQSAVFIVLAISGGINSTVTSTTPSRPATPVLYDYNAPIPITGAKWVWDDVGDK